MDPHRLAAITLAILSAASSTAGAQSFNPTPCTPSWTVSVTPDDSSFRDSAYLGRARDRIVRALTDRAEYVRADSGTQVVLTLLVQRSGSARATLNERSQDAGFDSIVESALLFLTGDLEPLPAEYSRVVLPLVARVTWSPPSRPAEPPPRARVFYEHEVDVPASPLPTNKPPRRPRSVRAYSTVTASFTVDTLGIADLASFEIDAANSEDAAQAVYEAVRAWRFTPARQGRRAVQMRYSVRHRFE